jgi:hypothetical protein
MTLEDIRDILAAAFKAQRDVKAQPVGPLGLVNW